MAFWANFITVRSELAAAPPDTTFIHTQDNSKFVMNHICTHLHTLAPINYQSGIHLVHTFPSKCA